MRRPRGMSLVEAMVAVFLLSLLILGGLSFFVRGVVWAGQVDRSQAALVVAQGLLDERKTSPYRELEEGRTEVEPVSVNGVSYRPAVEVTSLEGAKGIRVSVSWDEREGRRSLVVEGVTGPYLDGRRS